jgi:hypothetical protein
VIPVVPTQYEISTIRENSSRSANRPIVTLLLESACEPEWDSLMAEEEVREWGRAGEADVSVVRRAKRMEAGERLRMLELRILK